MSEVSTKDLRDSIELYHNRIPFGWRFTLEEELAAYDALVEKASNWDLLEQELEKRCELDLRKHSEVYGITSVSHQPYKSIADALKAVAK